MANTHLIKSCPWELVPLEIANLLNKIQKGYDKVTLENMKGQNESIDIKMGIDTIEGFSGHTDRKNLMQYVDHLNPRPDRVLVVHGDSSKTLDLASSIHKAFNIDTYAPKCLETIRLR